MSTDRGVAMGPAEVAALLEAQRTLTLATIGLDGRPHLASMWFAPEGADLLMWTYAASQKTRNLERDPRASVLGETGETYDTLRGFCLDVDVEVVRDPAEVLQIGRALHVRNLAGEPAEVEEAVRAQAGKRVGLRLRVGRTRSWDHRRLSVSTR
jgi:PPOX class probable F420-dependent enzyme